MTTMQRFKAYFGMVPPDDYEDDYLDDVASARRDDFRRDGYGRDLDARHRGYGRDDFGPDVYGANGYGPDGYADGVDDYDRVPDYSYAGGGRGAMGIDRPVPVGRGPRLEPLNAGSHAATMRATAVRGGGRVTRGALAVDSMDRAGAERVFEEGSPLAKITTLRPRDYSEARTIGERFRDGNPVIMDLVEMSNEDAKRLVDFAAGLAFALRGAFDKVATKVFLLSPADVDVSAEDRRKLAETGFYNQS